MASSEAKKIYRARKLKEGEDALERLVARDIRVVQLSEYHFRINGRLDVWPSSGKYYDIKNGAKGTCSKLFPFVMEYIKNGYRN